MSYYTKIINEIDPTVDAVGVECSMRLQYGTLNHLDNRTFKREIKLFKACCKEDPNFARDLKASYGYGEGALK